MSGVYWYVGVTGSGKTTLALEHIRKTISLTRYPLLTINTHGARNLAQLPHVNSVKAAVRKVWGARRHAAFIPKTSEEVGALLKAARAGGRAIILIDEAAAWINQYTSEEVMATFRVHRHSRLYIYCTTQSLGEISPRALQTTTRLHAFRNVSARVLERLEKEFQFDREKVRNLPRGEHLQWKGAFV